MSRKKVCGAVCAAVCWCAAVSPIVSAVPIFAGPAYDRATGTGYQTPIVSRRGVGIGIGVASAHKYTAGDGLGARGVRWDASGAMVELANLGTDASGRTVAVGYADKYDTSGNLLGVRAVMWGPDGLAIDLGTLIDPSRGWLYLAHAFDISDDNWITGLGLFDPDGTGPLPAYDRLFLLHAPIPEPSATTLLVAGALTLLARRRRV